METLVARAQHNDLKGLSAADWSDNNGNSKIMDAAGIDRNKYFLVGISIYAEGSEHVSLYVVEATTHAEMMAMVNNGTIHVTRIDTELTITDVLDCLKRFSVTLKHRDLKTIEVTYDV